MSVKSQKTEWAIRGKAPSLTVGGLDDPQYSDPPPFPEPRAGVARVLKGNWALFETGKREPVMMVDEWILPLTLLREVLVTMERAESESAAGE